MVLFLPFRLYLFKGRIAFDGLLMDTSRFVGVNSEGPKREISRVGSEPLLGPPPRQLLSC